MQTLIAYRVAEIHYTSGAGPSKLSVTLEDSTTYSNSKVTLTFEGNIADELQAEFTPNGEFSIDIRRFWDRGT